MRGIGLFVGPLATSAELLRPAIRALFEADGVAVGVELLTKRLPLLIQYTSGPLRQSSASLREWHGGLVLILLHALLDRSLTEDASAFCRHLVHRSDPSEPLLCSVVSILIEQECLELADEICGLGLRRYPDSPRLHSCLGAMHYLQGRLEAAEASLQQALSLDSDDANTHSNLGNALFAAGRVADAIGAYARAVQLDPQHVDAYSNLGNALQKSGRLDEAIEAYRQALAIRPDFTAALSNLGVAYQQKGCHDLAMECFETAIALDAQFADAWSNLGLALQEVGYYERATAAFETALSLGPEDPRYLANLACCSLEIGDLSRSIENYEHSLALAPHEPVFRLSYAIALLLVGEYERGWQYYEARQDAPVSLGQAVGPAWATARLDQLPISPGRQQRLVVLAEQGLGDTIQFCRYVKHLAAQGFSIDFGVQPELVALLSSSALGCRVVALDQAIRNFEGQPWLPLLSLPGLLSVGPAAPLLTDPYVMPVSESVQHWRNLFEPLAAPVVALNWQGNPKAEVNNLRGRSFPLEAFAPLASVQGCEFVSIQYGAGSEQLAVSSFRDRFSPLQERVDEAERFEDRAAILSNCSLVITSDTAVAHLAGALGVDVWLLLQAVPDWRWGLTGDTTFWYPTMRLFRQGSRGDWRAVMLEVQAALSEWLSARR